MERFVAEIRVLDRFGNWYTNAWVENDYDAIRICKFYKEQLGYHVQLLIDGKDMTGMIDAAKIVRVPAGLV